MLPTQQNVILYAMRFTPILTALYNHRKYFTENMDIYPSTDSLMSVWHDSI